MFLIRKAEAFDNAVVSELSMLLYDGVNTKDRCAFEEHLASNADYLSDPRMAIFLAVDGNEAVGFAHVALRSDYVEGTQGGTVGFLEGIYVTPQSRGRGIARALVAACENLARESGCVEFASDCELTNADSLAFHLKVGFAEANRIICFTKTL